MSRSARLLMTSWPQSRPACVIPTRDASVPPWGVQPTPVVLMKSFGLVGTGHLEFPIWERLGSVVVGLVPFGIAGDRVAVGPGQPEPRLRGRGGRRPVQLQPAEVGLADPGQRHPREGVAGGRRERLEGGGPLPRVALLDRQ